MYTPKIPAENASVVHCSRNARKKLYTTAVEEGFAKKNLTKFNSFLSGGKLTLRICCGPTSSLFCRTSLRLIFRGMMKAKVPQFRTRKKGRQRNEM